MLKETEINIEKISNLVMILNKVNTNIDRLLSSAKSPGQRRQWVVACFAMVGKLLC